MSSEDWLEDIQFHPIFSPPPSEQPTASTSTDVQTSSSLRRNLLAVRQTDLIVAVGKEIRILNLQEVAEKKQQDSSDVAYKVSIQLSHLYSTWVTNLMSVIQRS